MQFSFGFHSSLLLVFFVHTLVYSVLFYARFKRKEQQSSGWLSIFLLLAALYIAPWMLGFAGWYDNQPYRDILFYVPFQQLFLIGPVVFFYVASLLDPGFNIKGKNLIHLIPAAIYLLYCVVVVVYDKIVAKEYYFLASGEDPDFDTWYQLAGYLSMIIYFIAAIRYYYSYKKTVEAVISNSADFLFLWVRNFLMVFLVMLCARFLMALYELFYETAYIESWWYFLAFSICCYYIAIAGYANAVESKFFFRSSFFNPGNQVLLASPRRLALPEHNNIAFEEMNIGGQPGTPPAVPGELDEWKLRVEKLFTEEQVYTAPELSLFDIARTLKTNVSFLSMVVNRGFSSNFNDLVNGYRVAHFLQLVAQGEHKNHTLLSLAFDSGFNSKSTFNRAFKKCKGVSPQQFIRTSLT